MPGRADPRSALSGAPSGSGPLPRGAVRDVATIWVGLVATGIFGFGTRVLLGRALGPEDLGVIAGALALVLIIDRISNFGMNVLWLDVHGAEGPAARRWLRPVATVLGVTTALAIALGYIWALLAFPASTREVYLYVTPYVALHTIMLMLGAQCQVENRNLGLAVVNSLSTATRFVVAVAGFAAGWTLVDVARAFSAAGMVVGVLGLAAFIRLVRSPGTTGPTAARTAAAASTTSTTALSSVPSVVDALRHAWPFALSTALFSLYFWVDLLMIGVVENETEVGLYSAPVAIISFVNIAPGAIYRMYLSPRFHEWAHNDRARLRRVHERGTRLMLGLGVLAALVTAGLGPVLLRVAFGDEFRDAIPALLILALVVPVRFASASTRLVMSTRANALRRAGALGIAAVGNVALNLVLIGWIGIEGAAVATVVTEIVLYALLHRPANRFLAAGTDPGTA